MILTGAFIPSNNSGQLTWLYKCLLIYENLIHYKAIILLFSRKMIAKQYENYNNYKTEGLINILSYWDSLPVSYLLGKWVYGILSPLHLQQQSKKNNEYTII